MTELTTHERMTRMYEHREADRVPFSDGPWGSTVERWQREGMPADIPVDKYFGFDRFANLSVDTSPHYPAGLVEETDEYTITTSAWGVTMRNWKHAGGVPEFLDHTIKDADSWAEAKARMTPSRDRINWDVLKNNYKTWREEGTWIIGICWFGYDVLHSWISGTERVLMEMAMNPEWVVDAWNHLLDMDIAHWEMILDEGYAFDEIMWYDDMGYKNGTFFSLDMYRELLKPVHKRACDWAHSKGLKTHLHSCGNINAFIPDLIEIGVEMLNPLEVKAGMDPIALKKQYGDALAFHGGLNAVLYSKPEELWEEMKRTIPVMKQNGGYWISSDHSVPDSVSLKDFTRFVELAKELGSYE